MHVLNKSKGNKRVGFSGLDVVKCISYIHNKLTVCTHTAILMIHEGLY